jgi:hypothetical protein
VRIAGLSCARCGSRNLIAVEPGHDGDQVHVPGLAFALTPSRPARGWCARHALLQPVQMAGAD